MAYVTENNYTGNGSTVLYSFTFPYLETTDIKITVADVARTQGSGSDQWTLPNATQIQFNTAPTNGQAIRIYRDTNIDNLKAEFFAGSAIRSQDLNEDFLQNLYNSQEAEAAIDNKWEKGVSTLDSSEAFADSDDKIMTAAAIDDRINANIASQPLADTKILVGNGSGVATAVNVSGDATIANTGAVTIANNAINADKLANTSVDTNAIQDANVTLDKIEAVASTKIIVGNSSNRPAAVTMSGDATLSNTGALSLAADSVDTNEIADDAVEAAQLAGNAVVNASVSPSAAVEFTKLEDLDSAKILVGNSSNKAAEVAVSGDVTLANTGAFTIANDAVEIGMIGCEQTTISDSDSHLPTSGAVVDYVSTQLATVGGFDTIATDAAFPNSQPASGIIISIADAGGLVVNGSGVSTTGRTVGGSTVTINNINSQFNSTTVAAGVHFLVESTGSGHIYNYHKATLKEADLINLSSDIDDFGNRYRVHAGEPGSDNDEGDLVFDTSANKMKVYDGSSWGEVASTGEFKFLVPVNPGTTTAADWGNTGLTGGNSGTSWDLRESTNSGSAASITSALQLLVSVNGVVQKANTGSWSGSGEGFYLQDSDTIRFATAPAAGASVFVVQIGAATTLNVPADNSVTGAKIALGSDASGDIMYYNGTDYVRLAKGSDGEVLKLASGAPSWAADSSSDATKMPLAGGTFTGDVTWDNGTNSGKDMIWDESDDTLKLNDDVQISLGSDRDVRLYHTGSHGYINVVTGDLNIRTNGTESAIICTKDAGVALYYDAAKKVETVTGGVTVTGVCTATSFAGDGSALTGLAAGATGGNSGGNAVFWENEQTVTHDYTITNNRNAGSFGPITINSGITVTVGSGEYWTIV